MTEGELQERIREKFPEAIRLLDEYYDILEKEEDSRPKKAELEAAMERCLTRLRSQG